MTIDALLLVTPAGMDEGGKAASSTTSETACSFGVASEDAGTTPAVMRFLFFMILASRLSSAKRSWADVDQSNRSVIDRSLAAAELGLCGGVLAPAASVVVVAWATTSEAEVPADADALAPADDGASSAPTVSVSPARLCGCDGQGM